MLRVTCEILFFVSPLLLAAIAQGLCIKYDLFPFLKRPMDFRLTLRGRRILGDHKTWRGLVANTVACTVGTSLQMWLQQEISIPPWLTLVAYKEQGVVLGILLGIGMTIGEFPNSLLKRQLDIPAGGQGKRILGIVFFLLDQIDLLIGVWALTFFLVRPTIFLVLWSFVLVFVCHVAISMSGYALGMRKTLF